MIMCLKDRISHPCWNNNIETNEVANLILNEDTEGPSNHLVLPESLNVITKKLYILQCVTAWIK